MNRWCALVTLLCTSSVSYAQDFWVRLYAPGAPAQSSPSGNYWKYPQTGTTAVTVSKDLFNITTAEAATATLLEIAPTAASVSIPAITVTLPQTTNGEKIPAIVGTASLKIGSLAGFTTTARGVILSLQCAGDMTGDVSVAVAPSVTVDGALSATMSVYEPDLVSQLELVFGSIPSTGSLLYTAGSLPNVTVKTVMDGTLGTYSGRVNTVTVGTSTVQGRIGGTVFAVGGNGVLGTIQNVIGNTSGPAPDIGAGLNSSGDPTLAAKFYATDGVRRVAGARVVADIRGNGGFTPPGQSSALPKTTGPVHYVRVTQWFKGSIEGYQITQMGGLNELGVEVTGAFEGTLKFAKINSTILAGDAPIIKVGSVPTDPAGDYWLDLYGPSLALPSQTSIDSTTGVIIGSKIQATSGRLGSVRARAIVPRTPSTTIPWTASSFASFRAAGPVGRIVTQRLPTDTASTTVSDGDTSSFQLRSGDCYAVVSPVNPADPDAYSGPYYPFDGITVDGKYHGRIDVSTIGETLVKGAVLGVTMGYSTSIHCFTGVADGAAVRFGAFGATTSSSECNAGTGLFRCDNTIKGQVVFNVNNVSQTCAGWLGQLNIGTNTVGAFTSHNTAAAFGHTPGLNGTLTGYSAGAAPFELLYSDFYPEIGSTKLFTQVPANRFMDGFADGRVRIRYNGPVTGPVNGHKPYRILRFESSTNDYPDDSAHDVTALFNILPESTDRLNRGFMIWPVTCAGLLEYPTGGPLRFKVVYGAGADTPLCNLLNTSSSVPVAGAAAGAEIMRFRVNGCSVADVGIQGGVFGSDCILDNNDFVVFIDLYFAQDEMADLGQQGGIPGSDGQFDNNDFIVFIDYFFNSNCEQEGACAPRPSCYPAPPPPGGEGHAPGENMMQGAPADPAAEFRATLQAMIDSLPDGPRRSQLLEWLNALPPAPSGRDD